jgi:hypothetical protein
MHPRAAQNISLQHHNDGTATATLGASSWQLSASAAWVLAQADGDTTLQTLLSDSTYGGAVWDALDELADAGLLEARLSPPAGGATGHVVRAISRRQAFGRAAAMAMTAAGVGIALRSGVAHSEGDPTEAADAEENADAELKELANARRDRKEEHRKSETHLKQCRDNVEVKVKRGERGGCAAAEERLQASLKKEQAAKRQWQIRHKRHERRRKQIHRESATKAKR